MTSLSADHSVLFHASPARFRLRVIQSPNAERMPGASLPPVPSGPREVEAAIEEARRIGFQQGLREGTGQANSSWSALLAEILESLVRAVEQLRYEARQALRDCERPLLETALDLAARIVAREVEEGRYDIGRIVSQALAGFDPGDFELSVRVNPRDLDEISSIIDQMEPPRQIRLSPDPDVPAGGARLESERGNLPADITSRLQALHEALLADPQPLITAARETLATTAAQPEEARDVH
jgi:flagellar assembly protein FliH